MLSSSNFSSQGHSALDEDESGSSTLNSSHFTDETSDIRVDIGWKRDNNDTAGTEQPYTYPNNQENIIELATKILQRFGLEKEDLENLLLYPEDMITVTNLPAILRHIYIMKVNKTSHGSNFPRVTSTTGFDCFSCSEGEPIHRVDQNFGFDGVLEETRSSAEVKNWGDDDQKSSSTCSSSVRTFVDRPPNNLNNLPTQPGQSLQSIPSFFPLVTQDTDGSSDRSEPKSNWSSTPETRPIDEMKQFVSIPGDGEPGQAINDSMIKNDRQVINVVEKKKKKQKSNQEYQKTRSCSDLNPVPPPSVRPTCRPGAASAQWLLPPPGRAFLPEPAGFNGLPPNAMLEDYTAATPRAFPHTCSLCSTVCASIKDWVIHQNISFHIKACILLRKAYPNWDSTAPLFERFPDEDASTSAQTSQHYDHRVGSKSRSRFISPYRLENKCSRNGSSSRSPGPHFILTDSSNPEEQEDPNTHRNPQRRSPSGTSEKKTTSPSSQMRKKPRRSPSTQQRSSRVQQLTRKVMRSSGWSSRTASVRITKRDEPQ